MKTRNWMLAILALLLLGSGSAFAHGGRGSVGFYFGPAPYWGPWWYPPPVYYPAPPVVVVRPEPPPVYIEQEAPVSPAQPYWYYCRSSQGYYPTVKVCPEGWQKVLPQAER